MDNYNASLPEICKRLDRMMDSVDARRQLSLKTSVLLISGAARLYKKQMQQLLEDAAKLDKEIVFRNRINSIDVDKESSSDEETPEQIMHQAAEHADVSMEKLSIEPLFSSPAVNKHHSFSSVYNESKSSKSTKRHRTETGVQSPTKKQKSSHQSTELVSSDDSKDLETDLQVADSHESDEPTQQAKRLKRSKDSKSSNRSSYHRKTNNYHANYSQQSKYRSSDDSNDPDSNLNESSNNGTSDLETDLQVADSHESDVPTQQAKRLKRSKDSKSSNRSSYHRKTNNYHASYSQQSKYRSSNDPDSNFNESSNNGTSDLETDLQVADSHESDVPTQQAKRLKRSKDSKSSNRSSYHRKTNNYHASYSQQSKYRSSNDPDSNFNESSNNGTSDLETDSHESDEPTQQAKRPKTSEDSKSSNRSSYHRKTNNNRRKSQQSNCRTESTGRSDHPINVHASSVQQTPSRVTLGHLSYRENVKMSPTSTDIFDLVVGLPNNGEKTAYIDVKNSNVGSRNSNSGYTRNPDHKTGSSDKISENTRRFDELNTGRGFLTDDDGSASQKSIILMSAKNVRVPEVGRNKKTFKSCTNRKDQDSQRDSFYLHTRKSDHKSGSSDKISDKNSDNTRRFDELNTGRGFLTENDDSASQKSIILMSAKNVRVPEVGRNKKTSKSCTNQKDKDSQHDSFYLHTRKSDHKSGSSDKISDKNSDNTRRFDELNTGRGFLTENDDSASQKSIILMSAKNVRVPEVGRNKKTSKSCTNQKDKDSQHDSFYLHTRKSDHKSGSSDKISDKNSDNTRRFDELNTGRGFLTENDDSASQKSIILMSAKNVRVPEVGRNKKTSKSCTNQKDKDSQHDSFYLHTRKSDHKSGSSDKISDKNSDNTRRFDELNTGRGFLTENDDSASQKSIILMSAKNVSIPEVRHNKKTSKSCTNRKDRDSQRDSYYLHTRKSDHKSGSSDKISDKNSDNTRRFDELNTGRGFLTENDDSASQKSIILMSAKNVSIPEVRHNKKTSKSCTNRKDRDSQRDSYYLHTRKSDHKSGSSDKISDKNSDNTRRFDELNTDPGFLTDDDGSASQKSIILMSAKNVRVPEVGRNKKTAKSCTNRKDQDSQHDSFYLHTRKSDHKSGSSDKISDKNSDNTRRFDELNTGRGFLTDDDGSASQKSITRILMSAKNVRVPEVGRNKKTAKSCTNRKDQDSQRDSFYLHTRKSDHKSGSSDQTSDQALQIDSFDPQMIERDQSPPLGCSSCF